MKIEVKNKIVSVPGGVENLAFQRVVNAVKVKSVCIYIHAEILYRLAILHIENWTN